MSRLRVRDLGDSTHSGPEDHGHVKFRCHPEDGLADNLKGSLSIVSAGGLPLIRKTAIVWYFRGEQL